VTTVPIANIQIVDAFRQQTGARLDRITPAQLLEGVSVQNEIFRAVSRGAFVAMRYQRRIVSGVTMPAMAAR
jgi:hypothetical protein